jgi:hypothetical protein
MLTDYLIQFILSLKNQYDKSKDVQVAKIVKFLYFSKIFWYKSLMLDFRIDTEVWV